MLYLVSISGKNPFISLIQNTMKLRRIFMDAHIIASQPIPSFHAGGVIIKEDGIELNNYDKI